MSKLDELLGETNCTVAQVTGIKFKIVGAREDRAATMAKLDDYDVTISRSGPYTDQSMFPKVDSSRFMVSGFLPLYEDDDGSV